VSTRFLRSELRLIFSRRRNLAGLLVLAAVPVLLSVATKLSSPGNQSDSGDFFGSITDNGLFVALASLTIELGLFLPLGIAVISGDSLAGEANTGTLRYLLTVPVHRTRLLLVKYAAIVVFSLVETFTVTVTGLLMGLALFGGGPMTLLSGSQVSFGDGLLRVAAASVYLGLCFASLGAVGLFVSTLTEQPVGAMIAVVIFSTASFILDTIPQVSWVHPFLITHHWLAFGDLFREPVDWQGITQGLYVVAAYVVVFWLAAWARFTSKDITS
jgi:ABC-2 type transport system permease protein